MSVAGWVCLFGDVRDLIQHRRFVVVLRRFQHQGPDRLAALEKLAAKEQGGKVTSISGLVSRLWWSQGSLGSSWVDGAVDGGFLKSGGCFLKGGGGFLKAVPWKNPLDPAILREDRRRELLRRWPETIAAQGKNRAPTG